MRKAGGCDTAGRVRTSAPALVAQLQVSSAGTPGRFGLVQARKREDAAASQSSSVRWLSRTRTAQVSATE